MEMRLWEGGIEIDLVAIAESSAPHREDGASVLIRGARWLTPHDPLKVEVEVSGAAVALENLRLLTTTAINASLLLDQEDTRFPNRLTEGKEFGTQRIAGAMVVIPTAERLRDAIERWSVDRELIDLEAESVRELERQGAHACIAVVNLARIYLDSPATVLAKLKTLIRNTEAKAFHHAEWARKRLTAYAAVLGIVTALAAGAGVTATKLLDEGGPPCTITITTPSAQEELPDVHCESLLRSLSSGEEMVRVRAQQQALRSIGIDPGSEDGKEGPRTANGRDTFARMHGHEVGR